MSRGLATSVLAVCVSLALSQSGAAQEPRAPSAVQGGLVIYTVPSGLKVYISPDEEAARTAQRDPEESTPLVEKHAALDEGNFKGVTPLTVEVPPGSYLLAIAPIMLLDANYRMGAIDHSQVARAFVSLEPLGSQIATSIKDGLTGAAVYELTKDASARQVVVVLACGWDTPLEALEADYPPGSNFSFDDQQLRKELLDVKLPESNLDRVVSLLRRGGRVWLARGDLGWWIAIDPGGKWTIETKIRVRK